MNQFKVLSLNRAWLHRQELQLQMPSRQKMINQKKFHEQQRKAKLRRSVITMNDFGFLRFTETINYVRMSNVMFIMRGLPGSGKSSLVQAIKSKFTKAVICSADNFFMNGNQFVFDKNRLSEAHSYCQSLATDSCKNGVNVIIIDNTNVTRWETKFYLNLANTMGYLAVVVIPRTPWRFNPEECARRNKHNLTEEVIEYRLKSFQDIIPSYWGWFLNWSDSDFLLTQAHDYFYWCLQNVDGFEAYLHQSKTVEAMTFDDYYNGKRSSSMLHCTSCFIGWDKKTPRATEYSKSDIVQKSVGTLYSLKITAFFITPSTIGAQVVLKDNQKRLWNNDDDISAVKSSAANLDTPSSSKSTSTHDNNSGTSSRGRSSSEVVGVNQITVSLSQCDVSSQSQEENHSTAEKAHITLGYIAESQASQTGYDQLNLLQLERTQPPLRKLQADTAFVKYFGEGRCKVEFYRPIMVRSLFSGVY